MLLDLETTELNTHAGSIEGFNRTELENRNLCWKEFPIKQNWTFTSGQYIERFPSQVVHVMVTYKRIYWILVTHVTTMVTVYVSTEQSLQVLATYVGRH